MANDSTKVYGVVSIHKLRNGKTVQLYLSANKPLVQNIGSSGITPDWTAKKDENDNTVTVYNGPSIVPRIVGGEMSDWKWRKNGEILAEEKSETQGGSKPDEVEIDGYVFDNKNGTLTFTKSPLGWPVAEKDKANITYTFECNVSIEGNTPEPISRSIMVICREGGENSYWGLISAPEGTVLDDNQQEITLVPELWLGAYKCKEDAFSVAWKKGTEDIIKPSKDTDGLFFSGGDTKTLHVTRKGVDGMAHFECHFFNGGETPVEAEGIQVVDAKDEYRINATGVTNVYENDIITLQPSVIKIKDGTKVNCSGWGASVTDTERMNEYLPNVHYQIDEGSGLFTMPANLMYVPNTETVDGKVLLVEADRPWLKVNIDTAVESSGVRPVADKSHATSCDIIITFSATV